MNKNIVVKFGKVVKETRTKKGFTQEKLAFKAGVSSNYIGRIERGTVSPSITVVSQISDALEIKLSKLFDSL